jgi:hypothetical protein
LRVAVLLFMCCALSVGLIPHGLLSPQRYTVNVLAYGERKSLPTCTSKLHTAGSLGRMLSFCSSVSSAAHTCIEPRMQSSASDLSPRTPRLLSSLLEDVGRSEAAAYTLVQIITVWTSERHVLLD